MKKLLVAACAALLLAGCGGSSDKPESKTTCSMSQEGNGAKMETNIVYSHVDNDITRQLQTVTITAPDEKTYKALVPTVKASSLESKAKDVEGMKYELKFDDKKYTIVEVMDFDINKISAKDYGSFTNQTIDGSSLKGRMKLDITKESMEKSGLTCK